MDLFLQIWGGIFYLLSKILLAASESMNGSKKFRIIGWFFYLIGMPAWIILLASKNNWVVAAIDLGGIPSMILGIVIAWKQNIQVNKILDIFVKSFTFFMIILGTIYSIYYFHGITTFSQILEILVTFGFLFGSYLLAKNNPAGWLLFALMCICTGILMLIQDKTLLVFQQGISFVVVIVGYIRALKLSVIKKY
jgi:vacuolar-type H+-ATPase subunit I/STV1